MDLKLITGSVPLTVCFPNGSKWDLILPEGLDTFVENLMCMIQEKTGLRKDRERLKWGTQELNREDLIFHYPGLKAHSQIHLEPKP